MPRRPLHPILPLLRQSLNAFLPAPATACLALFALFAAAPARAQVVFSEILYHPVELEIFDTNGTPLLDLSQDTHEFVELYNAGASAVDLSGWSLSGGISFDFPSGSRIDAGLYLVIALDPASLAAVPQYGLSASQILGPYHGTLGNNGDTIRLRNINQEVVESVSYSAAFPWAIGADALGANDEWTGLNSADYQFRGRSLERVSFATSANDPANWLASPLVSGPSPGRANAVQRAQPQPVVVALSAVETNRGTVLIRSNQTVRLEATFSSTNELSGVVVEYFIDAINATNETHVTLSLAPVGSADERRFTATLPAQPDRSIVRYRIRADRGAGVETVSPRADDPFLWHAYFVTPARTSANPIYDCFISTTSLNTITTNISQSPRRIVLPDPPGMPRASWDATAPAVFVYNGVVYDIQIRYHGSRYNRNPGRNDYKVQFPNYRSFEGGRGSLFVTDKGEEHRLGSALYDLADLPVWRCRYVDFYLNNNGLALRLEQEELDKTVYARWDAEQSVKYPGRPLDGLGGVFKSTGVIPFESGVGQGTTTYFGSGEGPFFIGNGTVPPPKPGWTTRQRCEWTYTPQINSWKGGADVESLLVGMWAARGDSPLQPNPNLPALRSFLAANFDVDATLTYIAIRDWSGPFDNETQNHFLWRRANGLWAMLPWDLDSEFDTPTQALFWDEQQTPQPDTLRGPHWIKDSFFKAYRQEYKQKLWLLNNSLLDPATFPATGWTFMQGFAAARIASVNQQLGLGTFQRPLRPTNAAPANGQSVLPPASLAATPYAYSSTNVVPHASTLWLIRDAAGSYLAPVYRVASTSALTSILIPFDRLTFGGRYYWKCVYVDAAGHPSRESAETSFFFGGAVTPGVVQLSEVLADNQHTITNGNRTSDYIELHNSMPSPQSLATFSLTDDLLQPDKFLFPADALVPPGGFLIVWCDADTNAPGYHTGFGLNRDGQSVALFSAGTNGFQLADFVTFGLQLHDRSIGRIGDTWVLNLPTPGAANVANLVGSPATLRVNEWMATSSTGPDWFELFNPDPLPVALQDLWLADNPAAPTNTRIPALTFIDGRGFRRFIADQDLTQGARHVNFKIKSSGETLIVSRPDGSLIDSVHFGAQTTDVSQGRLPDGSTNIISFPGAASPEAPNFVLLTEVVVNEVLPDIELYNPGPSTIDLGGWSLSDDPLNLARYTFPANSPLPAGGYLTVSQATLPFAWNLIRGGDVILSHDGTHLARAHYSTWDGYAQGVTPTSLGTEFVRLQNPSFGATNSAPTVGPIVLSEILYHAPGLPGNNDDYQFLELENLQSGPVDLFEKGHPTVPWRLRDAVSYTFPAGVSLAGRERVLVVGFDPSTNSIAWSNFVYVFDLPASVRVFGPFSGKLAHTGASVDLVADRSPIQTPGPDFGYVPTVLQDRVQYTDHVPWPAGADGFGPSLQRIRADAYGNEPTNWSANGTSPGAVNRANASPVVALSAPVANATIGFGQPIALAAAAADTDGTVRLVEFFADGVSLGRAGRPDFTLQWTNAAPGAHSLTVVATDNALGQSSSGPVPITVVNQLPTVALLSPSDGAAVVLPTNLVLQAEANDRDGLIVSVGFFDNGVRIAEVAMAPYVFVWTNATAGTHVLTAVATDNGGGTQTSAAVTISATRTSYLAYSVPPGTIGTQPFGGGLGMDFDVVTPVLLTSLGVFDSGGNGIDASSTLTVQLYARSGNSGTVKATMAFSAADPGQLNGSSRLKVLAAPLILAPGSYSIVAYGFNNANLEGNVGTGNAKVWTTDDAGGLISFVGGSRYGGGTGAPGVFPATLDGGPADRYAAGTFEYRPVPTAATVIASPTNMLIRPGSNATFTVVAAGSAPLRYQWSFNGIPIAGATNATWVVTNAFGPNRGYYSAVVSNDTAAAATAPAFLEFLVDPVIVQAPLSQVVVSGSTVTFSVEITNTATLPIGYRWRRNGIQMTNAAFLLNERIAFLTVTNAQLPYTNYAVVVTNMARPAGLLSPSGFLTFAADADGDGIPDDWETSHGLNPASAADRDLDPDGDGLSNWEEYVSGTDPQQAGSRLELDGSLSAGGIVLSFDAASNHTYAIEFSDAPSGRPWQALTGFVARPLDRVEQVRDGPGGARFYRLTTPLQR